jgi:hypothetical protein
MGTSDEFGSWQVDPSGTAHYLIEGRCLCGTKVKEWKGPPEREAPNPNGGVGKFITPFCQKCMSQNYIRWARKGGKPADVLMSRLSSVAPRRWRPWELKRQEG